MAVTLAKLCSNADKTYELKLIAGSSGLENLVRWVHIVEDIEILSNLYGSELIFTSGIVNGGSSWLLAFIRKCFENHSTGVVLSIGSYIPSVPSKVIEFCEANNFALFTIPCSVHIIDVTYDFCHQILSGEEIEVGLSSAFQNAIFAPSDEASFKPTLERRGFYKDDKYTVFAIKLTNSKGQISEDDMKNLRFQANRLMNEIGVRFGLLFQEKKLIVIAQNCEHSKIEGFIASLLHHYKHHPEYCIYSGVGPSLIGYSSIADSYIKAISTLKIAVMHKISIMNYDDLGIYKLLISIENKNVLKEFYQENLLPIDEFDRQYGTDYLGTLKSYIENDSSVQEVARITGVHRNTINYKIKKIRELLNCELNGDMKLKITLALYIKNFL